MTYWCIALYVWGHFYTLWTKIMYQFILALSSRSSKICFNTTVIKATASIAVIYSLSIVPIDTQFYGWRVYSGCNYLTTISDLRVAYIIAASCLLRHADFLARILVQDIWQLKTLLISFAAINTLASDTSSGFCRQQSDTDTKRRWGTIYSQYINTVIKTVLMLV